MCALVCHVTRTSQLLQRDPENGGHVFGPEKEYCVHAIHPNLHILLQRDSWEPVLKDLMARRRFSPRSGSVHVHLEVLDTGSPVVYLSNHRCGALSRGKVKHGGNSKLGHVQKQLFFPKTNILSLK